MKKELLQFFQKIIKLWQSRNKEFKNMKIGSIFFLLFGVMCSLLSYFLVNENVLITSITKQIFQYFALLMFCIAINFYMFYLYVYNKINWLKNYAPYFLTPLVMILIVSLVIAIPAIILLGILSRILEFRARKIDNLINFMIYLVITIIVVGVLIYPTYILAYIISRLLENLLVIKYNWNLDMYPVGLFLFISLIKLEIDSFFRGLLFLKQKQMFKSMNRSLKLKESNLNKNISSLNVDIKVHIQSKNDLLKSEKDKLEHEMDYDITYLKNTLRKLELGILILSFVMVALKILPNELLEHLNKYQSDTINVLTVYTLIMLYLDKRKEWK